MSALAFNKTGVPEEGLQVIEKERPIPAAGEVLVKVLASPFNPADTFFIRGTYRFQPTFPDEIAGFEGAGIVESAGKDAAVPIGSLVAFFYRKTWAEYTVVPAAELAVLPGDFPIEKTAQFSLNPFTAWALLDAAQPPAGEWMLLTGPNSSVSPIPIHVAKQPTCPLTSLSKNPP